MVRSNPAYSGAGLAAVLAGALGEVECDDAERTERRMAEPEERSVGARDLYAGTRLKAHQG